MASKILISLPTTNSFQNPVQKNLQKKDYVTLSLNSNESSNGVVNLFSNAKDPLLKIDELEKNIKFLKEEQRHMLSSLHKEIASLQAQNRDLLYQLIFKGDCDNDYQNNVSDSDVKYILMSNESFKQKQNLHNECTVNTNCSVEDTYEMKYTIDQQRREIEYLMGQLELITVRNKNQNCESRQTDAYIRELEDRSRDQEKLIRLLRKENKEQKLEEGKGGRKTIEKRNMVSRWRERLKFSVRKQPIIENFRKTINSSIRMNGHVSQNFQITHVQPQAQLFPPIGSPAFWCQNRSMPISEYQLQRTSISANGNDRSPVSIPGVSYALPPICNYRQVAVTAPPPPRFYNNANYFYSIAQRPNTLRSKSYSNDSGIRSPNRNAGIQHDSKI